MEFSVEVRVPLIENHGEEGAFTNTGFDSFYDDTSSSSGYDSTDMSDSVSISSAESRGSDIDSCDESLNNLLPARDEQEEIMKFQSSHALCENLKLILAMPEMCDVTFLVGPREIQVHGVRAILGTRSRAMYQIILKHMAERSAQEQKKSKKDKKIKVKQSIGIARSSSERLEIPVKKYDSEVFQMLIEFIHCGTVNITEDTVAGLYCGACQFELADLGRACLEFVERCLEHGRAEKILFSTRCYRQHKATTRLFDKIYSVLDRRYVDTVKHTPVSSKIIAPLL